MSIFSWLFNRNETTKEVTTPTSTRGKWKRCAGTGKTMRNMHKVQAKWFGTCTTCGKVPVSAKKNGTARGHQAMTSQG